MPSSSRNWLGHDGSYYIWKQFVFVKTILWFSRKMHPAIQFFFCCFFFCHPWTIYFTVPTFSFPFYFLFFLHLLCFLALPFIHDLTSLNLSSYPNINRLRVPLIFLNIFHFPGDILSSAMQNLQNLVQMPYGCGEQNMVRFVPNIYVLNYLKETQQLTEKIKSKAISYLVSGERLPPKLKTFIDSLHISNQHPLD